MSLCRSSLVCGWVLLVLSSTAVWAQENEMVLIEQVTPGSTDTLELERTLELAYAAAAENDLATAERLFGEVEASNDGWYSWAATSGLVATYRMLGNFEAARAVTARVRGVRSDLAELMEVWDGDTAVLQGSFAPARARYEGVAQNGSARLAAVALRQLSRLALAEGNPGAAAAALRELVDRFPSESSPELNVAQAMFFDAMAAGALPLGSLASLLHEGVCSVEAPCLISAGNVERSAEGGVSLAELSELRFSLSSEDAARLETAIDAQEDSAALPTVAATCTVSATSSPFQYPMSNDHSGYIFMSSISQGYHPGLDINGPGDDCGVVFKAVSNGCVRDSSPTNWGSAVLEHYYLPGKWYSQYGHASTIYFSADAAITKGANLGKVGKVETASCHLHHEVREADHPSPTNADYYSNLTWANVGDWYQDPFPFHNAHKAFSIVRWVDDGAFTRFGTWTAVTTVGDQDNMRWATTTSTTSKTTYATYTFTPTTSGTYELWVFVPYNNATSTKAAYKLARTGGSTLLSGTVAQSSYSDAWVRVGSASLATNTSYYVEVASNTGESSKKVGLDNILLIRP